MTLFGFSTVATVGLVYFLKPSGKSSEICQGRDGIGSLYDSIQFSDVLESQDQDILDQIKQENLTDIYLDNV